MAVRSARLAGLTAICATLALPCAAQVTPAAGYTPPDNTPVIRIGAVIYTDYTVTEKPKGTDADGNEFTPNSFNVGRAYLNITGNISHIVAFRITPDITRETGTGSSLNGSYTYRLKYAYAQFNLDDWMPRGSWVRLGMQQTPWIDFEEGIYRYRFQGTVYAEREGFMSSSDVGATMHYNFKHNYGEIHGGVYNGENYNHFEANDQKAFQIRGTLRPLPQIGVLRGLRVTGFYDHDAYVKNADRERGIVAVTFEHPHLNTAVEYLQTTDQTSTKNGEIEIEGRVVLGNADERRMGGKDYFASTGSSRTRTWIQHARASSWAPPTGSRIRGPSPQRCWSTSKTWGTTTSHRLDPTNGATRFTR